MSAERLLTVDDLAAEWQCHRKTVLRAIRRGELEAAPLGKNGAYRVKREWADAYVEWKRDHHRRTVRAKAGTLSPVEANRGTVRSGERGKLVA